MNSTDEKMPAGSANSTAGGTDTLMVLDTACISKTFATLAARYALVGYTLTRSCAPDGVGVYHAAYLGVSRALTDLQAAAQFLVEIGGTA